MNSTTFLPNTGASAALLPGLNGGVLLSAAQPLAQNLGQPGFANALALQQDVALLQQQQPAALPSAAQAAAAPAADTAAPPTEAAPALESDQDAAEPVLEAQSSHVLATLGLWQPPVVAALQAVATPAAGSPTAPVAPPAPVVPVMPTAAATADAMPAAAAESTRLSMLQTVATGAKSGVKSFGTADSAPPASFEAALTLSAPSGGIDSVRPAVALASAVLPTSEAGPALAPALVPSLVLKGEPTQWQQPLLQALGDRLQLQIAARSEQAVIKLDPPMLGQIEIAIRQQAGELQVRMSASHGEVARQLHQVSDGLRQDLVQRHSGEVTVQVTQTARGGDDARQAGRDAQQQPSQQQAQDQREQQRRPGRGLHEDEAAARGFASSLNAADIPA